MDKIAVTEAGNVEDFLHSLQTRITKGKVMGQPVQSGIPPDVEPITTFEGEAFGASDTSDEE
jgi:hypothetical protein